MEVTDRINYNLCAEQIRKAMLASICLFNSNLDKISSIHCVDVKDYFLNLFLPYYLFQSLSLSLSLSLLFSFGSLQLEIL